MIKIPPYNKMAEHYIVAQKPNADRKSVLR